MDISNYNNKKQKHATIIVFMIIIIMQTQRGSKIKLLKGNPIFKGSNCSRFSFIISFFGG